MNKLIYLILSALLVTAPAVFAQTQTDSDGKTAVQGSETGSTTVTFEELSSGNQMIARSLLDAQLPDESDMDQAWTLDQIAAAGSSDGWGHVFQQMHSEGLIQAKNLGQVVSTYARNTHQSVPDMAAAESELSAEQSSAAEIQSNDEQDGEAAAEETDGVDTTATDAADTAESGDTEANMNTDAVEGAFDKMSAGNQKIARALMDAQVMPEDDSADILTLDEIAAAKSEAGWGRVFQQMQAKGLITAGNLGEVVSSYQRSLNMNTAAATADTSSMSSVAANGAAAHGHSDENLPAVQGAVITGNGTEINTGAGVTSSVNGNAYGLQNNNAAVSASQDISTASGAAIGLGHAGSVGAGVDSGVSTGMNTGIHSSNAASLPASVGTGITNGINAAGNTALGGNGLGHAYGRGK